MKQRKSGSPGKQPKPKVRRVAINAPVQSRATSTALRAGLLAQHGVDAFCAWANAPASLANPVAIITDGSDGYARSLFPKLPQGATAGGLAAAKDLLPGLRESIPEVVPHLEAASARAVLLVVGQGGATAVRVGVDEDTGQVIPGVPEGEAVPRAEAARMLALVRASEARGRAFEALGEVILQRWIDMPALESPDRVMLMAASETWPTLGNLAGIDPEAAAILAVDGFAVAPISMARAERIIMGRTGREDLVTRLREGRDQKNLIPTVLVMDPVGISLELAHPY